MSVPIPLRWDFSAPQLRGLARLVSLQIRFGDSLESEAVILCSRPGSSGGIRNAAKGATGDWRTGSVIAGLGRGAPSCLRKPAP